LIKLITTSDGSHSLFNDVLNETYHSVHGAIQESMHVFIKHGLEYKLQEASSPISILEVGFGTGLNALLTLRAAKAHQRKISYTTIEPHPLSGDLWSKLNYASSLGMENDFRKIHESNWADLIEIHSCFNLLKLCTTLQDVHLPMREFDLVYFDAFAPSKQPELWESTVLSKIEQAMRTRGIFVTYCAKGQLKRDLKELGLVVETLSGPPGKKEMVRAIKPELG